MVNKEKLLEVLTPWEEPFYWVKHNLTVIGDGYLEDGTRVHMVLDARIRDIMYLSNAYILSLPTAINEDTSEELEKYLGEFKDEELLAKVQDSVKKVMDKYVAMGWVKE